MTLPSPMTRTRVEYSPLVSFLPLVNNTVNTACATSNYQFINAATHIRAGQADLILAGGTEAACTKSGIGGFIACRALSSRNDDPAGASRPWDKGRDGFVMGEGAGILCMESLAHAKKRGANILGEYLGGGISTDAYDLTAPRADGGHRPGRQLRPEVDHEEADVDGEKEGAGDAPTSAPLVHRSGP